MVGERAKERKWCDVCVDWPVVSKVSLDLCGVSTRLSSQKVLQPSLGDRCSVTCGVLDSLQ